MNYFCSIRLEDSAPLVKISLFFRLRRNVKDHECFLLKKKMSATPHRGMKKGLQMNSATDEKEEEED